jgi:hypothetical protein
MSITWRWRMVALAAAAILINIPGAIQARPAADPLVAAPMASSALPADPAREVPCRRNVYPLAAYYKLLEDTPPHWYRPVTMASIGLSPDADEAAIPGLNTTTANSPRFRVNMIDYGRWVLWKSKQTYSETPLVPMMTGEGTLGEGFVEYKWVGPDQTVPNGILDAGDWLAMNYFPTMPITDYTDVLDSHIAAKTQMTILLSDIGDLQDIGFPTIYRVQRLIQVRLLDYGPTQLRSPWDGYLEFALLDDQKVCLATAALYMPKLAHR